MDQTPRRVRRLRPWVGLGLGLVLAGCGKAVEPGAPRIVYEPPPAPPAGGAAPAPSPGAPPAAAPSPATRPSPAPEAGGEAAPSRAGAAMPPAGGVAPARPPAARATPAPQPGPGTSGAPGAAGTYRVRPGDTLSGIAADIYGDPQAWRRLYEANRDRVRDPNLIEPGQVLVVP